MILVVHRNQADLPCVPSILKDENYKSGLRLGRHDQTLHMLQINAFGEGPVELLADSDVNEKNHQELFKLLQMVLPVSIDSVLFAVCCSPSLLPCTLTLTSLACLQLTERRASRSLLQRLFGR